MGVVPGDARDPQILTDQLTLSQPRGEENAHQMILAPPNFQTFQRPFKGIVKCAQELNY